ncbi:MAG: sigma-70 family RNA polymerase sigma factor [Phycisphaerales bacterium]|nr:sigma-70 family RNA polymerase sigma factor [Phycisphaerales bacterium]
MIPIASSPAADFDPAVESARVAALRRGDRTATDAFVREIYPRMLAAASTLVDHEHDAQDVAQDAVMGALTHLDQFRGDARLSTWALRILVNTALMHRRRTRRRPFVSIHGLLPRFGGDGHHVRGRPTGADASMLELDAGVRRALVRRCVSRLPDPYRTVIVLRDMHGLGTSDTAFVMGISTGAVKVRLHRARAALRQLIEDESTIGLDASGASGG